MSSWKRDIRLDVVQENGKNVIFKIAAQSHVKAQFSRQVDGRVFRASNGIVLVSGRSFSCHTNYHILYCRTGERGEEGKHISCPVDTFARVCAAVSEYNETDGEGRENRWPDRGDKCYYVGSTGVIEWCTFYRDRRDSMMRKFGNFFQTPEAAKCALDRVTQVLKSVDYVY